MKKQIIYLSLISLVIVGCEDIYNPKIDAVPGQLVVEAHLTNDSAQNFVKLTIARSYYSNAAIEPAIGAKVSLVQVGGVDQKGIEGNLGNFTFPGTPVPGKYYILRIQYDNNYYESSQVKMPPLPTIDTLYTPASINKSYITDAYGNPQLVEDPGRNISIDAPITADLKYYRFEYRAVLLWEYSPPLLVPDPPTWYGWLSVQSTSSFNIAGPKDFSVSDKIQNHKTLFITYNNQQYLDSIQQIPVGWILILDEYGTTKESYDFRRAMNRQFSAEGSLFDPVNTQIYSNIHCTNDPSKIVLGFFDLNSYRQYRYYLNLSTHDEMCVQRRLNRYPEIPSKGYLIGYRPAFWEFRY